MRVSVCIGVYQCVTISLIHITLQTRAKYMYHVVLRAYYARIDAYQRVFGVIHDASLIRR